MGTRNTRIPANGLTADETTALAELRRIHTGWTISVDTNGEFVATRSEPDDVIRAVLVETLGRRLYAAQCLRRKQKQAPVSTPTRVDQLKREDLVLMGPGHIRVITEVQRTPTGMVELRLGATWHSYEPHDELNLADRRSQ